MSDQDRGAYAPNSDAPLTFETFDARVRSSRRPFPMALIGSGVVLLLLVTALVMFYRSGSKAPEGLPRPVGGGITAIKTAPTGEQPSDPTAGLEVYSPQNVPSNTTVASAPAPQFTPAPEQPMARPAAPPPVVAQAPAPKAPALTTASPKPVAKTEAVAATTAKPAAGGAAPFPATVAKTTSVKTTSVAEQKAASPSSTTTTVKAAAAKPTVATTKPVSAPAKSASAASVAASEQAEDFAAGGATTPSVASGTVTTALRPTSAKPATSNTAPATKLAKSTPKPVEDSADEEAAAPAVAALPKGSLAAVKPTTAAPATAKGGFVVQVGAFPSAADADKGFSTASSKAGAAMSGKSKHVETVQKDGRTLYRSTVKGFATRDAAAQFCVALRAKGGQCIVRGGGGA